MGWGAVVSANVPSPLPRNTGKGGDTCLVVEGRHGEHELLEDVGKRERERWREMERERAREKKKASEIPHVKVRTSSR